MNHVERFRAVMNFQPVDRLPRWEWAMWWDETIARWKNEGLPCDLNEVIDIARADENVGRHLDGQTVKRAIYVRGRIVNFVVGG